MVSIAVNAQPTIAAVRDFCIESGTRVRAQGSSDPEAGPDSVRRTTPYVIVDKSLTRC